MSARENSADQADSLAPGVGLFADQDPVLFGQALAAAALGIARRPIGGARMGARTAGDLGRVPAVAAARMVGASPEPPVADDGKDRRFADRAWEDNAAFFALRQAYLLLGRLTDELIAISDVDDPTRGKAALAAGFLLDALAPTNFLLTNPAALKRAFETGGRSVLAGGRSLLLDTLRNGGRPRQVDTSPFRLGENLAATPSKVVFRNQLMEVLQYEPQTEQVHAVPLLASPPWINKYYVMDLSPGRSFLEWAVQQGRTVFAISYRNPDASMRDVSLDDYLIHGPRAALDVVTEITGADKVDIVGLCLGGVLTAMTDAYLAVGGDDRIGTLTLLNTMLDFSDPGALGCFTDEVSLARLQRRMARKGYLEGREMAGTFDLLRPNDLIFNYVASNWLMGEQPPAFDILAWNADSTRMPAQMHAFYLRSCYIDNEFARGRLELAGHRLGPRDIDSDLYVVAAENDHIVPWRSSYKTTQLVPADVRFVLSSGGHIAGIVNPPGPKAWYVTGDHCPADADQWRAAGTRHEGSWWEDWAGWSAARAGPLREPPPLGSSTHPVLGDGPGEYVRIS
jgi:polyhydroxyalkanoate synthase